VSDFRRAFCVPKRGGCGKHVTEVGPISWGGLCTACGKRKFHANADGLRAHSGPEFEKWRRALAAGIASVPLSDLEALVDDSG
jgi:hypothetical protein